MSEDQKHLGAYRLQQRIGAGGMAEVWKAEYSTFGACKTVAIKLLNAVSREREDYRKMFLDEARLSMMLSHSAIVQVFDAGEYAGECFMAMEWVDGLNLSQLNELLRERGEKLPLHVSVYIVCELLRALDHAHTLRDKKGSTIVHRDVSPQNVMVSVAGEVKLMDFGVARFQTEETAGTHVKGKLRYMPPEQLNGQSREPTVDLFAAGAVLYELIEGRRFRDSDDDAQLLPMIITGQVPPLSKPEALPAKVNEVLQGLLAPEPRVRIGSARAARQMLLEWPGYRDARIDLERYVVRYRDECPPPAVPSGSFSAEVQSRFAARADEIEAALEGGDSAWQAWQRGVNPSTATTNLDDRAVDDTNVNSSGRRRQRSRSRRAIAPLVAGMGLLIGSGSVAYAVHAASAKTPGESRRYWAEALEYEPPVAVADVEPVPEIELPPDPGPQPIVDTPPEPIADASADSETGESPVEEPVVEEPVVEEPEPKKTREKVKVNFSAGNFRSLNLKVGGRKLELVPTKKISLPVGSYTLKIRSYPSKDGESWQRVGRVKLSAGHEYEVVMTRPGGFKLVEVK
jgi:serine/threonine protein kinase